MNVSSLLVSVGNSRTRFCIAGDVEIEPSEILPNTDVSAITRRLIELATPEGVGPGTRSVPTYLASVNGGMADQITRGLEQRGIEVSRIGRDLPVPMVNALADDSTLGVDRLLDALGAFSRAGQACVVIDAGTAVTVDFVDGQGTFHGGAIAPGLTMMLRAMHEHTSALPEVMIDPAMVPPSEQGFEGEDGAEHAGQTPFGKSTRHAMIVGVVSAVRGLCHHLIDRYAEFYRGYPRVIATGGDAPLLFENDPLVEHVVPDLGLIGMHAALVRLREIDLDGDEDDAVPGA